MLLLISGASGSDTTSVREAIAPAFEPTVTAVELRHLGSVPGFSDARLASAYGRGGGVSRSAAGR